MNALKKIWIALISVTVMLMTAIYSYASYDIDLRGNVTGLDADETYVYGLYTIAGKQGEWTTVTGVTEITHDLTGLIGISVAGDGVWTSESKPVVGYVAGDVAARAEIGNVVDGKPLYDTSKRDFWQAGVWTGDYLSWYDQTEGAYSFLDQTAGTTCSDVETLWLYQNTKEDVEAKLTADAKIETLPNSWVTNSITSNPARLQAVINTHYAAPDYADTLAANKLAHQTKIANAFATRNISYAFDETEILPVDELLYMSFSTKRRQGGLSFTSVRSKVVVHVMDANANVTAHEWWSDEWSVTASGAWKKITADIQSIENLPEEGWVVGVEFFPWADVEPSTIVANSDTRIDASSIAFSFGQQQVCIGYYPADYVIAVAAPEVSFDAETGIVSGFEADKTYQYAPYSINGAGEATSVEAGAATLQLTEGLWAITEVVNGIVSQPVVVYYRTDRSTMTEIGTIVDAGTYKHYDYVGGDVWEQGKWSGLHLGVHSSFGSTYALGTLGGHIRSAGAKALYEATDDTTRAAAIAQILGDANAVNFRYAYANDEIIEAKDLLQIAFKTLRRMGTLTLGQGTAEVVFYIADETGAISEYTWSQRYNAQSGSFTVVTSDIENWPSEGWVVGFQIKPWQDLDPDGLVSKPDVVDGVIKFYSTMCNMTFVPASYKVVTGEKVAEVPTLNLTSNNNIQVTNYNSVLTYVYSADGGKTWTEFEGSSFAATKASTEYQVKSLASYPYEESAVSNAVVSPPVTLVGSSIVLDGQIGIKVYMDIDTSVLSDVALGMTRVNNDYQCTEGDKNYSTLYRVSGTASFSTGTEWAEKITLDKNSGLYYTVLYLPAKELDNTVIECDIGGYRSVNISFGDYITSAKALAKEGKTEFVLAEKLINKLEGYTAYAENYFNNGSLEAYNTEASLDKIESATKTNTELDGVRFFGTSLILEETVTIRHYFEITDLDAYNKAYTSDIPYGIKGSFIYYDITDIPAQSIGKQYTLTINGKDSVFEIKYSVANYIKSATSYDDKNLVSLANAIYDYGLEASKYEEMRTRNTNIAVNIAADGLENAILTNTVSDEAFYEEKIKSYISGYLLGTEVGRMMFNVTYRRSIVDSDTIDSMLYNVARDENGFLLKDENGNVTKTVAPETTYTMLKRYRTMMERGIDIVGMAVEETKKYGAEAWFSIRMNDHHNLEDPGFNSSFSYDTPTLSGINNGRTYMDFTKPAVQAYYKEYIREMCEKYDIDGIELDFLRSCPVMGTVTNERIESLNAFVSDIRKITNEAGEAKGKKIGLAVRIYSEEQQNLDYGIDAAQWVAEGSIDQITVEGWYIPTYYNIPVEEWRQSIDERNVNGNNYILLCGTDWAVRCDSTAYSGYIMWITLEQFKGFVSSAYDKGADGIYIFNHFNLTNDAGATTYYIDENGVKTKVNVIKDKLIAANSQEDAEKGTRVYVNTCRNYSNSLYPISIGEYTFELNTGTKAEDEYIVVVGIDANDGYTDNLLSVSVNGVKAEQIDDVPSETGFEWRVSTSNEPAAQHVSETAPRVMQFRITDLSAVNNGVNTVTVTNTDEARPQSIKWLEIRVK